MMNQIHRYANYQTGFCSLLLLVWHYRIFYRKGSRIMLPIEDFIISVYYYASNYFKEISVGQKLRSRGFGPSLSDSEVITMEIVGEYLGIDADKCRWEYFRRPI